MKKLSLKEVIRKWYSLENYVFEIEGVGIITATYHPRKQYTVCLRRYKNPSLGFSTNNLIKGVSDQDRFLVLDPDTEVNVFFDYTLTEEELV